MPICPYFDLISNFIESLLVKPPTPRNRKRKSTTNHLPEPPKKQVAAVVVAEQVAHTHNENVSTIEIELADEISDGEVARDEGVEESDCEVEFEGTNCNLKS